MTYELVASDAFESPEFHRLPGKFLSRAIPVAAALALSVMVGAVIFHPPRIAAPQLAGAPVAPPKAVAPAPKAVAGPYGALFDPGFFAGSAQFSTAQHPSGGARRQQTSAIPTGAADPYGVLFDPGFSAGSAEFSAAHSPAAGSTPLPAPPAPAVANPAPEYLPPPPPLAAPAPDEGAPLPPARPAEFASPVGPHAAVSHVARPGRSVPPVAAAPDTRNFFEKLFGLGKAAAPAQADTAKPSGRTAANIANPSEPAPAGFARPSGRTLASASAQSGLLGAAMGGVAGPSSRYDKWTAVYDLAAHTVYLPNGTRLEAHSGLGDRLDDPGHVNERNRGATPPHVYELEAREQLFHGVQALRLNPVGGGDIFGRAGLLAHSYMLGPNGDSNGCVSFRNYDAFLQAFQTGQVKRLAVVARLD